MKQNYDPYLRIKSVQKKSEVLGSNPLPPLSHFVDAISIPTFSFQKVGEQMLLQL
jgi:hypothetical protein